MSYLPSLVTVVTYTPCYTISFVLGTDILKGFTRQRFYSEDRYRGGKKDKVKVLTAPIYQLTNVSNSGTHPNGERLFGSRDFGSRLPVMEET